MRLKELYELIDKYAPFALSREYCERYGAYDNSGVIVDCGEEISCVLFSLDLSRRAVERAKEEGADCIVTHHPAIFRAVKGLRAGGEGDAVLACARAGISVISAHLNLDAAKEGIDDALMRGLGGKKPLAVKDVLTGGGYGRVFDGMRMSFPTFVSFVRRTFSTERTVAYGERNVERIASFCGAGLGEEEAEFAAANGADTVVSSDGKHHVIAAAVERGLNVLLLPHYAAENYGFMRFADAMKARLGGRARAVAFTDERFL